jgi:FG-GAP repeat
MLRRTTRPTVARRLPLRLESMESRLAPAIFNVTNLNDSGTGSLRQAVVDANSNSGFDTVLFGFTTGTITLTSGDIQITDALDIFGPGSSKLTVSGNKQSRIFTIVDNQTSNYHVGISGMTLTLGNATVVPLPQSGADSTNGGAILGGSEELDIRDSTISNNVGSRGGAIDLGSDGRLTIINSLITGNSSSNAGGAIYANDNTVTIINTSTVSGNTASNGSGGGVYVDARSTLFVEGSSVTGNSASNSGGGIYCYGNSSLTVNTSTIAGNTSGNRGGGIAGYFVGVDLTNSTISGNSAQRGGGIFLGGSFYGPGNVREPSYSPGPANINHCTITGNTVSAPSATSSGGGIFSGRDVTMANTIVALNSADSGRDLEGIIPDLVSANKFFSSFCLIQDKGNANVIDQGGTIFGVAPLLGPLQNNGGPTHTIALLSGSRGIDEGDPEFAPPPPTDQRGFPRVANNRLDIGAYEVEPGVVPPVVPPPTNLVAVGSGPGGDSMVRVYDNAGKLLITFQPFDTSFKGEIHVATGDVNGDGVEDVVTGAGAGGGPHVQTFDGKALLSGHAERIVSALGSYFAYNPAFRGGVNVAVGDVNGDGKADIITGAGPGGGPHVIAWDAATGNAITSFFAYNAAFTGGVNVGAGDFFGTGKDEIVTGAGPGGGPHVRVFDQSGTVLKEFFAYDAAFHGGVYVAAGDITGDGKADIVTGAGAGGGPHVRVFDGTTLVCVRSFFAFDPAFTGGVRVAVGNLDADSNAEIIVGAGPLGGPHVRFVDNDVNDTQLNSFYSIDKDFNGGVFVG